MKKISCLVSSIILLILTACGDDGGKSSATSGSTHTTLVAPTVHIAIGSSVPTQARSKITTITSPFGSSPIGSAVEVPFLHGSEETMLLASNANDDIYLAALANKDNPSPELTASTTAVALCRLINGATPPDVDSVKLNSALEAAPEFPHLVNLINASLAAGTPPIEYPGISVSIQIALVQATNSLRSKKTLFSAAKLAPRTVETPLPFKLLEVNKTIYADVTGIGFFSVKITGANDGLNGVNVQNGFTINWAVQSRKADGSDSIITNGGSPDGIPQVILPKADFLFQGDEVGVPGDGEAWNLILMQTPVTRKANVIVGTQDFLDSSATYQKLQGMEQGCASKFITETLTSEPLAPWASEKDVNAALRAVEDSVSSGKTWKAFGEVLFSCVKENIKASPSAEAAEAEAILAEATASTFGEKLAPYLNKTFKLGNVYADAALLFDGIANLGSRAILTKRYWNTREEYGVCEGLRPRIVSNCAASIIGDPENLDLKIGVPGTFINYFALDRNGKHTAIPFEVEYSSSDPETVDVDKKTGLVTALKRTATPVAITLTEPYSGAKGVVNVTVKDANDPTCGTTVTFTHLGETCFLYFRLWDYPEHRIYLGSIPDRIIGLTGTTSMNHDGRTGCGIDDPECYYVLGVVSDGGRGSIPFSVYADSAHTEPAIYSGVFTNDYH